MTFDEFDRWLEQKISSIKHLLTKKARYYVRGVVSDRDRIDKNCFKAFESASALYENHYNVVDFIHFFMTKHIVKLFDWHKDCVTPTEEEASEVFTDIHNYLFLLEAAYKDERERERQSNGKQAQ